MERLDICAVIALVDDVESVLAVQIFGVGDIAAESVYVAPAAGGLHAHDTDMIFVGE